PEAAYVAVDGAQVYPRKGRTVVASEPAWSRDGHSLAFLELPAARPPRLVLLAEFRSEEHTSELQSRVDLVCRLLLEKKKSQETCSAEGGKYGYPGGGKETRTKRKGKNVIIQLEEE